MWHQVTAGWELTITLNPVRSRFMVESNQKCVNVVWFTYVPANVWQHAVPAMMLPLNNSMWIPALCPSSCIPPSDCFLTHCIRLASETATETITSLWVQQAAQCSFVLVTLLPISVGNRLHQIKLMVLGCLVKTLGSIVQFTTLWQPIDCTEMLCVRKKACLCQRTCHLVHLSDIQK